MTTPRGSRDTHVDSAGSLERPSAACPLWAPRASTPSSPAQFLSLTRLFFVQHGGDGFASDRDPGRLCCPWPCSLPAVLGYGLETGSLFGPLIAGGADLGGPSRRRSACSSSSTAGVEGNIDHGGGSRPGAVPRHPGLGRPGLDAAGLAGHGSRRARSLRVGARRERGRHDGDDDGRLREHADDRAGVSTVALPHAGSARLLAAAVPHRAAAQPRTIAPRDLRRRLLRARPADPVPEARPDLPGRPVHPRVPVRPAPPCRAARPSPRGRAARWLRSPSQ